jgi:uncharacterized protein YbbC (DUF1343 family)
VIAGTAKVREAFELGTPIAELEENWEAGLSEFKKLRQQFLLY